MKLRRAAVAFWCMGVAFLVSGATGRPAMITIGIAALVVGFGIQKSGH